MFIIFELICTIICLGWGIYAFMLTIAAMNLKDFPALIVPIYLLVSFFGFWAAWHCFPFKGSLKDLFQASSRKVQNSNVLEESNLLKMLRIYFIVYLAVGLGIIVFWAFIAISMIAGPGPAFNFQKDFLPLLAISCVPVGIGIYMVYTGFKKFVEYKNMRSLSNDQIPSKNVQMEFNFGRSNPNVSKTTRISQISTTSNIPNFILKIDEVGSKVVSFDKFFKQILEGDKIMFLYDPKVKTTLQSLRDVIASQKMEIEEFEKNNN